MLHDPLAPRLVKPPAACTDTELSEWMKFYGGAYAQARASGFTARAAQCLQRAEVLADEARRRQQEAEARWYAENPKACG